MKKPDPIFLEPGFTSSAMGPSFGCGVYAVCVTRKDRVREDNDYVVYIGSSSCISKRVMACVHVYRRIFNIVRNYYVYTLSFDCDNYIEVEKQLIKKYKPRFNRNGK